MDFIEENKLYNKKTFVVFLDDDVILRDGFFIETIKKNADIYDGFTFNMIQIGNAKIVDMSQYQVSTLLEPFVGSVNPFLGIIFDGFFLKTKCNRAVDWLPSCMAAYNFSKTRHERFDYALNGGSYWGDDVCFFYGLKKKLKLSFCYISNYSYIHKPASFGGCRIDTVNSFFLYYFKHKSYIIKKYHGWLWIFSTIFSFFELIFWSLVFKKNLLLNRYAKS